MDFIFKPSTIPQFNYTRAVVSENLACQFNVCYQIHVGNFSQCRKTGQTGRYIDMPKIKLCSDHGLIYYVSDIID